MSSIAVTLLRVETAVEDASVVDVVTVVAAAPARASGFEVAAVVVAVVVVVVVARASFPSGPLSLDAACARLSALSACLNR